MPAQSAATALASGASTRRMHLPLRRPLAPLTALASGASTRSPHLPLRRPLARLSHRSDCAGDDDDAFYLFSQEHKVDRAGLPTARETGLHHHLRAGAGAGVERPGGLLWDEVPVRILRLPQERIDPQAKAEILAPLTALWREESPGGRDFTSVAVSSS